MAESTSDIDDLIDGPEPPGVVDGLSYEEREDEFLRLLGMGCTVRESARAVAVNFSTMYRKRSADPAFAKRWDDAKRVKVGHLIAEAERRAMRGSDKLLIFLLQAADPAKFRHQSSIDVTSSDGSLSAMEDGDRASRVAALMAVAKARRSAESVDDLL